MRSVGFFFSEKNCSLSIENQIGSTIYHFVLKLLFMPCCFQEKVFHEEKPSNSSMVRITFDSNPAPTFCQWQLGNEYIRDGESKNNIKSSAISKSNENSSDEYEVYLNFQMKQQLAESNHSFECTNEIGTRDYQFELPALPPSTTPLPPIIPSLTSITTILASNSTTMAPSSTTMTPTSTTNGDQRVRCSYVISKLN